MKICKEKGCGDKILARGWCKKHYMRWYRHGNPLFIKMHGYSNHPLYGIWKEMKQRCYNKNCKGYKDYGDRGIAICNEWRNNSETFIEWALPLWKEGLLIDRRDNNGNYEPSNCRFVTHEESNLNKRLLQRNNTSGYRGVSFSKQNKKWEAYMKINNKRKYLGLFDSSKLAALAYDNAVPKGRPKNFKMEG